MVSLRRLKECVTKLKIRYSEEESAHKAMQQFKRCRKHDYQVQPRRTQKKSRRDSGLETREETAILHYERCCNKRRKVELKLAELLDQINERLRIDDPKKGYDVNKAIRTFKKRGSKLDIYTWVSGNLNLDLNKFDLRLNRVPHGHYVIQLDDDQIFSYLRALYEPRGDGNGIKHEDESTDIRNSLKWDIYLEMVQKDREIEGCP